MKTDLQTLQDLFEIGYETFEESRVEERIIRNMYHNRQYTDDQLSTLERRGQPAETFNVIKLFARLLVGYYSTVVNTVKVNPRQESDTLTAMLLHDVVQYTFEQNHFETEGDKIKLDGMLSGLMCAYETVVQTGETDEYGRPINRIELSHVPSREIVLDPMSRKEDYSDARFIHRFKWVSEDYLVKMLKDLGKDPEEFIAKLDAYDNHLDQDDTEFEEYYGQEFEGRYRRYDNYLLVNTIIEDDDGDYWSIFWTDDEEISREKVTFSNVRFPYRVQKLHTSDQAEYYGLFREIYQSQYAINQALLKIQLSANSRRALVEDGGVDDIDEFTDAFNRVNGVIPVKKLSKVLVDDQSREVMEQYVIIDKAFDRIQRVLGVNDSFLGMAFASDSGRKVKLQQNATTLSLRYVTVRVEQFYRLLGWDIVSLVQQYYTAHEVLRIADEPTGVRWAEINKPMQMPTGNIGPDGIPEVTTPMEEVLDPASGEPMVVDGNYVVAPIPEPETEIAFSKVDLSIDTTAYNDEDEKNQLMLESILQGPIGQMLMQVNPAAYLKAASLSIRSVRTKHSHQIAELIEQTGAMMSPQEQMMHQQALMGNSEQNQQPPKSQELKLPQNTNEGI